MTKTHFDQMAEAFAEHKGVYDPQTVDPDDKAFIVDAIKREVLSDVRDEYLRQAKADIQAKAKRYREELLAQVELERSKADIEAKNYKKNLFRRAKKRLIAETMGVAFCIGILVNQLTLCIPQSAGAMTIAIVLSACACVLFVLFET